MTPMAQVDGWIEAKLMRRGVLASEMRSACEDATNRLLALFEVRKQHGHPYLHTFDLNFVTAVVAHNVRTKRQRKTFSVGMRLAEEWP